MSYELPIVATREPPITVFVTLGNRGSELSYRDWTTLRLEVIDTLSCVNARFQDGWFSAQNLDYQTACWCIDVKPGAVHALKGELAVVAARYGRGLIGWNEIASSVLLG